MTLRNLPGGVPEPEELIGRDHLIDVLWQQLAGNNVMLVAPRRFGKTGVMRHVLLRPRNGFLPVFLEVENVNSPEDFAAELLDGLLQHSTLRTLIQGVRSAPGKLLKIVTDHVDAIGSEDFKVTLRASLGPSWKSLVKRLVLEMEKADKTVLFLIDEFPALIENVARDCGEARAVDLLAWFRQLRLRQKDELRRFRFIVGGSTSIDMILRRLGAPEKVNDFFRLPVEPLAQPHAETLLGGLAEKYGLDMTAEATEALFRLIGAPVPYFIHLFVSQILVEEGLKGRPLTRADVERVCQQRLLGPSLRATFDYYRQRLKRYGKAGERAAIALLSALAQSPTGRVADSVLYEAYRKARKKGASELEYREIMADLECDWYVVLDTATNEYRFLLDLMRAWWNRYYRSVSRPQKPEGAR